jgi:hypothetical protein
MRKLGFIFLLLSFLLQSCTIRHYSLQNKIINQPCNSENLENILEGDTIATSKVLSEKHFKAIEVTDGVKPNLSISIMIVPHVGAVAEEYITGLSFGLIPTWTTRENQSISYFIIDLRDYKVTYFKDFNMMKAQYGLDVTPKIFVTFQDLLGQWSSTAKLNELRSLLR